MKLLNKLINALDQYFSKDDKIIIAQLKKENKDLYDEIDNLDKALDLLTIEFEKLNYKYQESIKKEKIVLDKDYYEGKREQQAWIYNGNRLDSKDVKEYLKVSKEGEQAIKELCKQLISKYSLSTNSKAQQIPEAVMKHFMTRGLWVYKYDKKKQGVPEYWQDAYTSLKDKSGDCEDLAILMYNVIYYTYEILGLQKYQWRNTFVCSSVLGEGGHGFNTFLGDDGQYYVVESTYDLQGSYRRTWLKTPIINNNMYYGFWGFATKYKSWRGSLTAFKGLNN